jgi:hypothetical protein
MNYTVTFEPVAYIFVEDIEADSPGEAEEIAWNLAARRLQDLEDVGLSDPRVYIDMQFNVKATSVEEVDES